MSKRGAVLDYTGATSRMDAERGLALNPRLWAFMEKKDGVFCRVATDHAGRISSMLYRSGEPVPHGETGGLIGMAIGLPDGVVHGELTAGTEAGIRERETLGAPIVSLFDCSRAYGQNLERLPFVERYGWLHRWQAATECYEPQLARNDWWTVDDGGRAHGRDGRFVQAVAKDLRRVPILPLVRGTEGAKALWRDVQRRGGEGIVACRLGARIGARRAKVKVKVENELECVVVEVGVIGARMLWGDRSFFVSCRGWTSRLAPRMVVSVKSDGFYDCGLPRFARVVRIREDLTRSAVPAQE